MGRGRVCSAHQVLYAFLGAQAETWTADTVIPVDTMEHLGALFSAYFVRIKFLILVVQRVLIVASSTALMAAAVNCAALGTVLIVRRQIKFSYSQCAGFISSASAFSRSDAGPPPPSFAAAAPFGVSVTPASPPLGPAPAPPGAVVPAQPASLTPSLMTEPSRSPSRADVRALATRSDGGVGRERAKHLQRLQRAETDLVTTGATMILLAVALAVHGLWSIPIIPHLHMISADVYEAALLAGTWIYALINVVSLT